MTTNWNELNFDRKWLSNIVIPGTHDSLTYGSSSYISSAQSYPIETQINDGIRYFDLRFRYVNNTTFGEDYQAYHGASSFPVYLLHDNPVDIPNQSNQNLGLSVRNAFTKYLLNTGIEKEIFMLEWRLDESDNTDIENINSFWNNVKNIFPEANIITHFDVAKLLNLTNNVNTECGSLPAITGKDLGMLQIGPLTNSKQGPLILNYAHEYETIPCNIKPYFFDYNNDTIFNTYAQFIGFNNEPGDMLEYYTSPDYTDKIGQNNPKINILAITQSSGNIVSSLFNTATTITPVMTDFILNKGPNGDPDNVPAVPNYKNVFGPANNYGEPKSKLGNPLYNYNIITTNYYELAPFVENIIQLNKLNKTFMVN
jgi:hypothetical protein